MEDIFVPLGFTLLGIVWITFHYITKWKTAPTLTTNDEALLEDLYQLARRLDDRMDTVERLVAADNPDFREARQLTDGSAKAPSLDDLTAAPTKLRSGR
ncbi:MULTISPECIES: envelope stress response membrane protein PspB [unclassified Novosphingobium]|uniref:envelope stress response membrane protein PspB n=1 Tax=unclassified Novosphingobium TaxID=2644732 RepID=UPI000EE3993E|nr:MULTISPECIES: envelope stress response membrane protein PspB [unclassified Novosphingobium]HCF25516.1 envelope stress response membrane protein PspB [Novosphingobium sp.]HQV04792.1 envelope stress response membrane protein PspB [Novosphingobium sp.]